METVFAVAFAGSVAIVTSVLTHPNYLGKMRFSFSPVRTGREINRIRGKTYATRTDRIESLLAELLLTNPDDLRIPRLKELRAKMRPQAGRETCSSKDYDGSIHRQ